MGLRELLCLLPSRLSVCLSYNETTKFPFLSSNAHTVSLYIFHFIWIQNRSRETEHTIYSAQIYTRCDPSRTMYYHHVLSLAHSISLQRYRASESDDLLKIQQERANDLLKFQQERERERELLKMAHHHHYDNDDTKSSSATRTSSASSLTSLGSGRLERVNSSPAPLVPALRVGQANAAGKTLKRSVSFNTTLSIREFNKVSGVRLYGVVVVVVCGVGGGRLCGSVRQ